MGDGASGGVRCFLGIGSNLGDRLGHLQQALDALDAEPRLRVVAVSPVYETEPVGGPPQDDFLNAVVEIETDLAPRELLDVTQFLEQAAHRVREERWGPRTLDVDILLYGEERVSEPGLEIPHPRMSERAFVLAPLHDLAADLVTVPEGGWTGVRPAAVALRVP